MNYLERAMLNEEYREPEGCARSMMVLFLVILALIIVTVSAIKDLRHAGDTMTTVDTATVYITEE